MKHQLTRSICMNKSCEWSITNHSVHDGIQCPRCKAPVWTEYVNKDEHLGIVEAINGCEQIGDTTKHYINLLEGDVFNDSKD